MAKFSKNVGPCEIIFDGVSLGLTLGGTKLVAEQSVFKTVADVTGTNARGKVITGESVMITAAITEITYAQMAAIIGTTVSGSTTKAVTMKSQVGRDLLDDVGLMVLKPIVNGVTSTVAADWIYVPAATVMAKFNVDQNLTSQRGWAFEGEGHPVIAEHIATGGHLYNAGTPEYAVGDLVRFGKATSV